MSRCQMSDVTPPAPDHPPPPLVEAGQGQKAEAARALKKNVKKRFFRKIAIDIITTICIGHNNNLLLPSIMKKRFWPRPVPLRLVEGWVSQPPVAGPCSDWSAPGDAGL